MLNELLRGFFSRAMKGGGEWRTIFSQNVDFRSPAPLGDCNEGRIFNRRASVAFVHASAQSDQRMQTKKLSQPVIQHKHSCKFPLRAQTRMSNPRLVRVKGGL